jgi:hypothetical protein
MDVKLPETSIQSGRQIEKLVITGKHDRWAGGSICNRHGDNQLMR